MRALRPRSCVLLQLGRRGGRGRHQAGASHRAGARRGGQARDRVRRGRLPRAHAGDARGRLVGSQARAVRARARGLQHVPRNDLAALAAAVGPGTCAVLVEPIQGEGGVWPMDAAWLELARELCDRHGALLLYDEVQTGIGRCGAWFCAELAGVRPDATAVAKGLAGGLPIGALLASDTPDGGFERGDHATTFGGSPPIAAAALAVLAAIEREDLVENARAVGEHISGARRRPARRGSRARSRAAARDRAREAAAQPRCRRHCGRAASSSTRSPRRRCDSCRHCASRRAKPTVSVPLSRMCWPLAATSMPPQWHKPGMR